MTDDRTTLRQVAARCFEGLDPERIAAELRLGMDEARDKVERVEAVLLLLARSFPPGLIPRAARLEAGEAEAILEAIREGLGGAEGVLAVVASRHLEESIPANELTKRSRASAAEAEIVPNESTEEALGVLDFWTSKWE